MVPPASEGALSTQAVRRTAGVRGRATVGSVTGQAAREEKLMSRKAERTFHDTLSLFERLCRAESLSRPIDSDDHVNTDDWTPGDRWHLQLLAIKARMRAAKLGPK